MTLSRDFPRQITSLARRAREAANRNIRTVSERQLTLIRAQVTGFDAATQRVFVQRFERSAPDPLPYQLIPPGASPPPIGSTIYGFNNGAKPVFIGAPPERAVSNVRGDVNVTINVNSPRIQYYTVPFTANRTLTLPSANVVGGMTFTVVRSVPSSFTLDIGPGVFSIPVDVAATVDVFHDGSVWRVLRYSQMP